MTDVGQEGVTLDDLDGDPAMFTTWENRRIFRLAKERIAELRQLITELEVKNDGLKRDLDKALMDHRSTIEDIEAESSRDDPDSVG